MRQVINIPSRTRHSSEGLKKEPGIEAERPLLSKRQVMGAQSVVVASGISDFVLGIFEFMSLARLISYGLNVEMRIKENCPHFLLK